jgi:thymidylate synthase
MQHNMIFPSINAIQTKLCAEIMAHGLLVEPRGMSTRELLGMSFVLANPRARLTTLKTRRWSPGLAAAELLWNVRGETAVEPLAFYNPRWRDFADSNGIVRGSCYGAKIFQKDEKGNSQWMNVRDLLIEDKSSRRAVFNFRQELDVSEKTNDMSCTNTMQFIVRENKLHAFVSMRSNDVIWGVPYDTFLFTCLQELMAIELGLDLGHYYHTAASMHIYARHFELAHKIAAEEENDLGLMPKIEDAETLFRLSQAEAKLRDEGAAPSVTSTAFEEICMNFLSAHPTIRKLVA